MALFDSILKRMGLKRTDAPPESEKTVRRHPPPDTAKPTVKKPSLSAKAGSAVHGKGDRILGRYEVGDVKRGGFGYVYLCYDQQYRLPLALKTPIEKDYSDSGITYQDILDKFYLEAEAWVRLEKHKNIVQAKGVERIDGQPYIFLEFVTGHEIYGPNLTGWLKNGPLGITRSLNFALQFCTGMEYAAHKFQVLGKPFVHRDINPNNVLVTHDEVVKITDFGLVKIFDATEEDIFRWAGTEKFMSPEQWQGLTDIDQRSDVYSFGCLLYAMLTGHPPYRDNYRYNHLYGTPRPLKDLVPALSDRLNFLAMKCLEKDREERALEDNRPLDFGILKRELVDLYQELTGETVKEETAAELEAWERLNKGVALCRLGFRQQAVTEYLHAMAADPRAVDSFMPTNLTHTMEWHCPESRQDKLVFHIQSVFTNYNQQQNLAKVLDILVSKYGLKVITVEGGSGPVDLTFYRDLPDGPKKEETARYFLKEARIQGHEYFAIITKDDIVFYGAEEPGLHERQTESLKKSLPEISRWMACCDGVASALIALKSYVYNAELKLFELQTRVFQEFSLERLNFFKSMVDQLGLPGPYPNLSLMCEAVALGQRLDTKKAQEETKSLLDFLNRSLGEDAKEGLNKAIHDHRNKEISDYHFFGYLRDLTIKHFTLAFLKDYPHLEIYLQHILKRGEVKIYDLFADELEDAEEKIREKLYTDEDQLRLDLFLKFARFLKSAYEARLVPTQLAFLQQHRATISGQVIVDFISQQAAKHGLKVATGSSSQEGAIVLPEEAARLGDNLWHPDSYYSLTTERSLKMIQNCLRYMAEEGEAGGILVTGGFHTRSLTAYLREQKIPYVVMAPDYEQSDADEQRYLDAILGKKTPMEEALEKKKGRED